MQLAVRLTHRQIEAASKLQSLLATASPVYEALYALNDRLPGFSEQVVLVKAAALNQLYYTNVWAIGRMAKHIVRVMNGSSAGLRDYHLVEELASIPQAEAHPRSRQHLSFASKFAHYFIDEHAFPIYDSYAAQMISHHLGSQNMSRNPDHPYQAFCQNFEALREKAELTSTTKELDSYLWIAGQYLKWVKQVNAGKKITVNTEASRLFRDSSKNTKKLLLKLMGQD